MAEPTERVAEITEICLDLRGKLPPADNSKLTEIMKRATHISLEFGDCPAFWGEMLAVVRLICQDPAATTRRSVTRDGWVCDVGSVILEKRGVKTRCGFVELTGKDEPEALIIVIKAFAESMQ